MKNKLLGLISAILLICSSVGAQNIHIEYSDGTNTSYAIDDVRKITFTDDIMNLHLNDGSNYSWDVSLIDYYQYELDPLQLNRILENVNSMEVNILPNPAENNLTVSFINKEPQKICLSIFDLQGRILHEETWNSMEMGKTSYTIGLNSIPSGQYFICLTEQNTSITKKFIKK
jgi:hypothetical protein